MEIKVGYVYHIKDSYFTKTGDSYLSINKESGHTRPTLICMQDENPNLYWAVPISSQVERYQDRISRSVERYGECLTAVEAKWNGAPAMFLLGNLFPVTEKYIDHPHLVLNKPVRVHYKIMDNLIPKLQKVLRIHATGKRVASTDLSRLTRIMLEELATELVSLATTASASPVSVAPQTPQFSSATSQIRFTAEELNVLITLVQNEMQLQIQACDKANEYKLSGLVLQSQRTLSLMDSICSKIDAVRVTEHTPPATSSCQRMSERITAAQQSAASQISHSHRQSYVPNK